MLCRLQSIALSQGVFKELQATIIKFKGFLPHLIFSEEKRNKKKRTNPQVPAFVLLKTYCTSA